MSISKKHLHLPSKENHAMASNGFTKIQLIFAVSLLPRDYYERKTAKKYAKTNPSKNPSFP